MTIALPRARTLLSNEVRDVAPPITRYSDREAFSPLEQSVIQLSRRDPLSSITDLPGWWRRLGAIFAVGHRKPLANERLEELRRFAILTRKLRDPGDEAIDRFLDAGFTLEQAVEVRDLVRSWGGLTDARRFDLVLWAMLFLIGAGTYFLMDKVVEEPIIGLIAAGVVFVTVASFASPGGRTR